MPLLLLDIYYPELAIAHVIVAAGCIMNILNWQLHVWKIFGVKNWFRGPAQTEDFVYLVIMQNVFRVHDQVTYLIWVEI